MRRKNVIRPIKMTAKMNATIDATIDAMLRQDWSQDAW
jgi:hypothetical protein